MNVFFYVTKEILSNNDLFIAENIVFVPSGYFSMFNLILLYKLVEIKAQ